jgi:phosphatidylglycerophosphatase A
MNLKTKAIVKFVTTFSYLGYFPKIPGTAGSLAGALIFILLGKNHTSVVLATIIITALGFLFCGPAEKAFKKKDPSAVVIDEVSGMLLCYCFVPMNWPNILAGFVLFRIFDIIKPLKIRKMESFKGGLGIMLDDILAAAYVVLILLFFNYIRQIF